MPSRSSRAHLQTMSRLLARCALARRSARRLGSAYSSCRFLFGRVMAGASLDVSAGSGHDHGMLVSDFFAFLLSEPVYRGLVLMMAASQLVLWAYMLGSHYLVKQRLLSVELRHQMLMEKLIAANAGVEILRRDTLERIERIRG